MNPRDNPQRTLVIRHSDLDEAAREGLLPAAAVPALWEHLVARRGGAGALGATEASGTSGTSGGLGGSGGSGPVATHAAADTAAATAGAQGPARGPESPRFGFTHLLYYFGGLLAIGAATLFMTEAFERIGPWGLFGIAVVYAAACVVGARWLDGKGLVIPAGILATLAVCLVPLGTWAVQHALGLWPELAPGAPSRYQQYHTHIDWRWLTLELATLAAAAVALWRLRYPFLMMPVAITLWYMSMDLARLIVAPGSSTETWTFYRDFSMVFGLLMALLGFWVDARSRAPGGSGRDYAFWLYLLGMLTFWGALSSRRSDSELDKLLYALLNLGFVFLGVVLQRRIFTILGGFGVAGYLGYLSYKVFKDSLLFPIALTLIGLAVIALGIAWQRNEARLQAALRRALPTSLHRWMPPD